MLPKLSPADDTLSFMNSRDLQIRSKPYLRKIYVEWAETILKNLAPSGVTVEFGATNPVIRRVFSHVNVFGMDVMPIRTLAIQADATQMPFASCSITNLVATDTFHHLPDAEPFLAEVLRVLTVGGRLILIEPWSNLFANFIYRRFHPEPFDPSAGWTTSGDGPMTRANGALPWIVFERDRKLLAERFPALRITTLYQLMPFSYLVQVVRDLGLGCLERFTNSFAKLNRSLNIVE